MIYIIIFAHFFFSYISQLVLMDTEHEEKVMAFEEMQMLPLVSIYEILYFIILESRLCFDGLDLKKYIQLCLFSNEPSPISPPICREIELTFLSRLPVFKERSFKLQPGGDSFGKINKRAS